MINLVGSDNEQRTLELMPQGKKPHTLFVTCADNLTHATPVNPELPPDLFIIRNVGNFIPPYHPSAHYSEAAAIEFAFTYLNITDIVICGHSHCAAMKACHAFEDTNLPHNLDEWIEQIRSQISFHAQTTIDEMAYRNILNQVENIKKYPIVQKKLSRQTLTIHAWFFNVETNTVHEWDKHTHQFQTIKQTELLYE